MKQSTNTTARLDELNIDQHGCCLLRNALAPNDTILLAEELDSSLAAQDAALVGSRTRTFGARNLAENWTGWRLLLKCNTIRQLLQSQVGSSFGLVRILYFDKPPGDGWALPWHRDLTIAVREHLDPLTPFSKSTTKAGVPHVEATPEVLANMLTLRLSLDPMNAENGPLLFIPGSHEGNDLATNLASDGLELHCGAGDVFAMRPRLLHASRKADAAVDIHRRVVHLEFAPSDILPAPWQWNCFLPG